MVIMICILIYVLVCFMESVEKRNYYDRQQTEDYYNSLLKLYHGYTKMKTYVKKLITKINF